MLFYAENEGVILSEQGTTTLDNDWYDSQIEVLSDGEVRVAVWSGDAFAEINTNDHPCVGFYNLRKVLRKNELLKKQK